MQRIRELPADIVQQIDERIRELFIMFDENGDQVIDKHELLKAFNGLGHSMDELEAMSIIQKVDKDNNGTIDIEEFKQIMRPEMYNRLLEQDEAVENVRDMFKEADTDYSGYLEPDEVYTILLKRGIDITKDELIELIAEFDVSGDAQLNIDEFVTMMNSPSSLSFCNEKNKEVYLKIRMSRLNCLDFLKAIRNLPSAFVPSVFHSKWTKEHKHRPSDVLKAQLDPLTMTWKDLLPMLTEMFTKEMERDRSQRPFIRPIKNQYGCEITVMEAEGIPLPPDGQGFLRSMIVKRAVRIGLFNHATKDYFANAVQVEASWAPNVEDKWTFRRDAKSLNPVLFRSTESDNLSLENMHFVFEFVIYYKNENQNSELCCGWAMTSNLQDYVTRNLNS